MLPIILLLNAGNYVPDNTLDVNESAQIDTKRTFVDSEFDGSRNQRMYFRCTITTINSTFSNCYAFGVGLTFGSGGAIYLSLSNLDSKDTKYINNIANDGGSLSIRGANMMINNNYFQNNTATHNGGSIFVTATSNGLLTEVDSPDDEKVFDVKPNIYITRSVFKDNTAGSNGGAIFVQTGDSVLIEYSSINNNCAKFSGGAIYMSNTMSNLVENNLTSNSCNYAQQKIFKFKSLNNYGGGAICVNYKSGIYTNGNTFDMNFVNNSLIGKPGVDIHFAGKEVIQWVSRNECVLSTNYFELLIASVIPKDCYAKHIYIEDPGFEIYKQVTISSYSYPKKIIYDDKTDYTNYPSPSSINQEYSAISTQKFDMPEKFKSFVTVDITSSTPTRSVISTQIPSNYVKSMTKTSTLSYIYTKTMILTKILTTDTQNSIPIEYITFVNQETSTNVEIMINTEIPIYVESSDDKTLSKKDKNAIIAIAVVSGLILITLCVIGIICLLKRSSDVESSTASSDVFIESEAVSLNQIALQNIVTVDNPLFSTTLDEDDPFKMDFSDSQSVNYFITTTQDPDISTVEEE